MKKTIVAILHLGYWFLYLFLLFVLASLLLAKPLRQGAIDFPAISLFFLATAIVPALLGFYTFYTRLFAHFLSRRRILPLFGAGIAVSLGCGLCGIFLLSLLSLKYHSLHPFSNGWNAAVPVFILIALNGLFNGGMGLIIKGFITWYADIKLKEELNKKNYETEMELVKSQLHPHFLFNTINNIDILIERDPVRASAYLNQLSDIMRFMLYEAKAAEIPVEKELTYIEKYVGLQQIRTSNPDYVDYQAAGNATGKRIAPMLFIPFIENAFKYAENKKTAQAIKIRVTITENKIIFNCENKYAADVQVRLEQGGLGNELIRKRLELLYPGKHTLEITDRDRIYKVVLTLVSP